MVTTRSQERKIGSFSSPLPAVEASIALSPKAGITPTRKSRTPSTRTPSSGKALASSAKKIEVVIDVAPNHEANPSHLGQGHAQSGGNGNGAEISQTQPGNFVPPHASGFQGVPEDPSPNGGAKTGQLDDRGALGNMSQDGRDVEATLADRSKRLVSPNHTPASLPKRKRFSSEDLEETASGAEVSVDHLTSAVTSNAAGTDGVEKSDDEDDDAPPEVVSSSVAAQQALGTLNPSLQHTNRKRRKILRNVNRELGSPVQVPDQAIAPKPQTPDTAQDEAEEPTTSSQITQHGGAAVESGQSPESITDHQSAVKTTPDESIEIVTAPTPNESPAPANTTTQPARKKSGPQTPDGFNTTAQRQPSDLLAEEDISTSNEVTRLVHPGEQGQLAVNFSASRPRDTSMADCDPSVTNPDVPYAPPQGAAETEETAKSSVMIPAPEGLAQGTPELNTINPNTLETTASADLPTRTQLIEGVAVKRPNSRTPTSGARPKNRPSPHAQEVLSRPKQTTLQQYRTRLLGRHPRTMNWGVPGFRKAKFVGV